MGRPFDELPELRELIFPFGDSGLCGALSPHSQVQLGICTCLPTPERSWLLLIFKDMGDHPSGSRFSSVR